MIKRISAAVALASLLLGATPAPQAPPSPPPLTFPDRPLHAQYTVEINHLGQVVRIDHGNLSGDRSFDTMTLGNALQMWIRKPDGSAVPGLYSVRYDYNNSTHKVGRVPSLLSAGGTWSNKPGAATLIVKEAKRQTLEAYYRIKAEQKKIEEARAKHLPDINAAVKRARSSPSPKPRAR